MKLTIKQLIDKLAQSANDHDTNTGEDNGDLREILEIALQTLKAEELIPQFLENLQDAGLSELIEFEWLEDA